MEKSSNLTQEELHWAFVSALGDNVVSHSNLVLKPLEVDLKPPLPQKIRLYIFNATHPPGGRTMGEHKIQLIVPGQERGQSGSFDQTGGRIVLLAGYEPELEIFILWDSGLYPDFTYSRNVQVKAETVYGAFAGKVCQQKRHIRRQKLEIKVETVLTARAKLLEEALLTRMKLTRTRMISG